jgi:hypothetical protein
LITHNLKDFLISLIEEDLNIQVVWSIPQEILDTLI